MKQDRNRLYLGVAAAVIVAAGAGYGVARLTGAPTPQKDAETAETPAGHGVVSLDAKAIQGSGIAVETVQPGGLAAEILAQATVMAAPGGEAMVTARAAGAVTRINVRLGDPVREGQALAVVESREAAQIAADRTAAAARATLAQRNLAREKSLFEQRVSPRMDYETAQAEAAAANAVAQAARAAASVANVTSDGRGVVLTSPISGRVTVSKVSLGAYVAPETELFRVADPGRVQIEAVLPARDAARVQPGDRAVVELSDGRTLNVAVRSVTPGLDPESRSATAVLEAAGVSLQPGLTARVRILVGGAASGSRIVVPDEAVQTVDGRDVVFVRTATGFVVRPVTRGLTSAGRSEVVSGLRGGEQIATRNAFLLKAELGKGAGDED